MYSNSYRPAKPLLTRRGHGIILCVLLPLSFILFSSLCSHKSTLIKKTISSLQAVHAASYSLVNRERINDVILTGKQDIKWVSKPLKCHIYFIEPNKGSELIFCEGQNNNEAVYSPNGFPYLNIKLNPLGALARKNNHHTLYETGFLPFIDILQAIESSPIHTILELNTRIIGGQVCRLVEISNPNFKFAPYTIISHEESIRSIAKKKRISSYLVAEKNNMDALDILPIGRKILIPNSYAKKINMWIDLENSIPICLEFYDEKGLFAQYEFSNLKLNPNFNDLEFSEEIFGKHVHNE